MKSLLCVLLVYACFIFGGMEILSAQGGNQDEVVYWRVPSKQFDPEDMGMNASDRVWSFAQEENGLIYACASYGIYCYDGVRWKHVFDGITSVNSLMFYGRGRGFLCINDHVLTVEKTREGWLVNDPEQSLISEENRRFDEIYLLDEGRILFTSNHSSYYQDDSGIHSLGKLPGHHGWTHEIRGQVYSMDNNGDLYRFDKDHWVHDRHFPLLEGVQTVAVMEDNSQEDGMLFISYRKGIYRASGEHIEKIACEAYDEGYQANVYHAIRSRRGDYILCTLGQGVFRINAQGEVLNVYTLRNAGLQSDIVNNLFEDKQGGLWLATEKGVTFLPQNEPYEILDEASGFFDTVVNGYLDEDEGVLGTSTGVLELKKAGDNLVISRHETNGGEVHSLLSVEDGYLLATYQMVYHLDAQSNIAVESDTNRNLMVASPFTRNRLLSFFEGQLYQDVWRAGQIEREGEFQTEMSGFYGIVDQASGVPMVIGRDSHIYEWYQEGEKNELRPLEAPFSEVETISSDKECIWVASESGIFYRKNDPDALFERHPISDVIHLSEDEYFTQILRLDGDQLLLVIVSKSRSRCIVLDLETAQIDNNYQWVRCLNGFDLWRGAYSSQNGITLFGSSGVVKETRSTPFLAETVFPLKITHAGWRSRDGNEGMIAEDGSIPYEQNSVTFEFAWPSYRYDYNGDSLIRYRYRINGAQDEWSLWSSLAQVNYDRLPEGGYRFEVEAQELGAEEVLSTSFYFRIRPPWMLTWWAYFLYLLVMVFVVLLLVRWRIAVYEEKNWLERFEREKLMRLENSRKDAQMQALKLQLNPHFLVNALNSIGAQESMDKVKTLTGQVAEFLNGVLYDQRNDRVPVGKELEAAHRYLRIAKFQMGPRLEYELETRLKREAMLVPTMIIQPLIENAVKYGSPGEDKIRRIWVIVEEFEDRLEIRVENTGTWLPRDKNYQGIGVKSVQDRLNLLHEGKSSFEIGPQGDKVCAVIRILF